MENVGFRLSSAGRQNRVAGEDPQFRRQRTDVACRVAGASQSSRLYSGAGPDEVVHGVDEVDSRLGWEVGLRAPVAEHRRLDVIDVPLSEPRLRLLHGRGEAPVEGDHDGHFGCANGVGEVDRLALASAGRLFD